MRTSLASLTALPLLLATAASGGPTPYLPGTQEVQLSPDECARLIIQNINEASALLRDALRDGPGKGAEEEAQIYLTAIKKAVAVSNEANYQAEFLMGVVLNQALILTYGTPK